MFAVIKKGIARGEVVAPPSKSYAHRYLIGAALSGHSMVDNIVLSDDIKATMGCLKNLGFSCECFACNLYKIKGSISPTGDPLNCNESGSTLRFLIPVVLATCGKAKFIGTKKLFSRGLSLYEDIFKKQGIQYSLTDHSLTVEGHLKAGKYQVATNVSSQFVTGLIFGLSLLEEDSEIELIGNIESEPYIDITIDVLHKFAVEITREDRIIHIKGGQKYKKSAQVVEGDYSNAAFMDAFNYIGGSVKVLGLSKVSLQGDKVYKEIFDKLANWDWINGDEPIDLSNCIDLGPICFALASLLRGAKFTGVSRLRIKESDRIKDMADVLSRFCKVLNEKDNVVSVVNYGTEKTDVNVYPINDHRIVMAAAVMLTTTGGRLYNIEAVNKSYPNFFEDLEELGIGVEIHESN